MKMVIALVTIALAVNLPATRAADDVTMQKLLSGDVVPLSLTLQQIDGSWRKFQLGGNGAGSGMPGMSPYLAMLGLSGGSAYYTRGEVKTVSGEPFLIAYRLETKPIDMQMMFRGGMRPDQMPKPEPPTVDSRLVLSLVHLRTAGNLVEIQPFDLERELAGGDDSPEGRNKAREGAAKAAGLDRLRQLGVALMMYANDGKKTLPPMETPAAAQQALKPYVGSKEPFASEDGVAYLPNPSLSGRKISEIKQPQEMAAFYESQPGKAGRGVLFLDGHVARVSDEDWTKLKKASGIE